MRRSHLLHRRILQCHWSILCSTLTPAHGVACGMSTCAGSQADYPDVLRLPEHPQASGPPVNRRVALRARWRLGRTSWQPHIRTLGTTC